MPPFYRYNTSRSDIEQWDEGLPSRYKGLTLKKRIKLLSKTITGSTSSQSSSSGSSSDGLNRYSAIHMVATAGIVTAAGSPAAVSSAGISPTSNHPSSSTALNSYESGYSLVAATMATGSPSAVRSVDVSSSRRSISSTIRNFLLESTSSLASSNRSNRWSTSAISETRMSDFHEENNGLPDLQEENYELSSEAESEAVDTVRPTISYGSDNGDYANIVTQAPSSNHLCVPGSHLQRPELRLQTSFQSISTTISEVSCAGSWDKASEAYTPNTDIGGEDYGGGRYVLGKESLYDSRSPESESSAIVLKCTGIRSPIQDTHAGLAAFDPLYTLTKGAELLDHVLGYLTPSDVTNLQLVCKFWDHLLRHSGVYHTLIHQRYHYMRPGPSDIQTTRTYENLKRVVKQDKAIKEGRLSLLTQLDIPDHAPRVRYHSGYTCFSQASSGTLCDKGKGKDKCRDSHEVLVYNFLQRKDAPAIFPCSQGSKILSVTLGGGVGNGVHLVCCEVDENFHASISCYLVPDRMKKWQTTFPSHLVLSGVDRAITQTNGLLTVVAVKDRIIAWDRNGIQIGDIVLLPQQANFQAKKGGRLYLSSNHIYLATWGAGETTTITAYCNRTFTLVMRDELSISGPVVQVSGLFLGGKLYLAVASCVPSSLYSTWSAFYVDDKRPDTAKLVENFPKLNDWPNANIVYYPYHERAYIISHSDFLSRRPTNNLSVVNISTGKGECLVKEQGYLPDLMVDGDCFTPLPLQGDNEFLICCTTGKIKVYKFDYD